MTRLLHVLRKSWEVPYDKPFSYQLEVYANRLLVIVVVWAIMALVAFSIVSI